MAGDVLKSVPMKTQLYAICIALGICFTVAQATVAQCTCGNGSTPDSVVNTFTLAPTSNFSSAITFPKFNPAIGTLSCVNLSANVTAVSNLSIRNLDSVQRDYEFLYTQAVSFTGPGGLTSFANTSLFYGPASLDAFGTGIDSAHFGPDTPFKNFGLSKTVSNVSPYLGSGNVSINYTNTGSTLLLQGSNNYQSTVSTFAWGDFKLTYYWCAANALPTGMKNFSVTRNDNTVLLEWATENEVLNTAYEVQLSTDGHGFKSLNGSPGQRKGATAFEATYQFVYETNNSPKGKLFFRVKQMKPSGQVGYSNIKAVDFSATNADVLIVTPNPVVRDMVIGFKQPQTGEFKVELVNGLGQQVLAKTYSLASQNKLQLHLNQSAQPGIYYLRIRNMRTNEQLVQKIILR